MTRAVVVAFVILALPLITACEAEQCVQMRACCAAISEHEWVGDACGSLVANLQDPQSCSGVVAAIEVAAADNGTPLPAVCK